MKRLIPGIIVLAAFTSLAPERAGAVDPISMDDLRDIEGTLESQVRDVLDGILGSAAYAVYVKAVVDNDPRKLKAYYEEKALANLPGLPSGNTAKGAPGNALQALIKKRKFYLVFDKSITRDQETVATDILAAKMNIRPKRGDVLKIRRAEVPGAVAAGSRQGGWIETAIGVTGAALLLAMFALFRQLGWFRRGGRRMAETVRAMGEEAGKVMARPAKQDQSQFRFFGAGKNPAGPTETAAPAGADTEKTERNLMRFIEMEDPATLERIRSSYFSFESIPMVPPDVMRAVFKRDFDPDVIIDALEGADTAVAQAVLSALPSRTRSIVKGVQAAASMGGKTNSKLVAENRRYLVACILTELDTRGIRPADLVRGKSSVPPVFKGPAGPEASV